MDYPKIIARSFVNSVLAFFQCGILCVMHKWQGFEFACLTGFYFLTIELLSKKDKE